MDSSGVDSSRKRNTHTYVFSCVCVVTCDCKDCCITVSITGGVHREPICYGDVWGRKLGVWDPGEGEATT
jgi:hypothetical protein